MSSVRFSQVGLDALAQVGDDGKRVQRELIFANGHKKIVGCLLGGGDGCRFLLRTEQSSERFEITQGACDIVVDGETTSYSEGGSLFVGAGKTIEVIARGVVQYIRHFEG